MSKSSELFKLSEGILDKAIADVKAKLDDENSRRKSVLGSNWQLPISKISDQDIKSIWPDNYKEIINAKNKLVKLKSDKEAREKAYVQDILNRKSKSDNRPEYQRILSGALGYAGAVETKYDDYIVYENNHGKFHMKAVVYPAKKLIKFNGNVDDYFSMLMRADHYGWKVDKE